jgi:hypothetical protein
MEGDVMRGMVRMLSVAALSLAAVLGGSATASAAGWYYTGYWTYTNAQCHQKWEDLHASTAAAQRHECRPVNGVFALWGWG